MAKRGTEAESRQGGGDRLDVVDAAQRFLDAYAVRVALSVLILVSVLPLAEIAAAWGREFGPGRAARLDAFFLLVFGAEFVVRVVTFRRAWREGRAGLVETILLGLDFIAVLSFLPLQHVFELRYVRLIRLSRLVLLLGYWGDMVRDLWRILISRERRFQVAFVVVTAFILSFGAAVLLHVVVPPGSANAEALPGGFFGRLWWSFRQVEDPGNLVAAPRHAVILAMSLFLTFSGLLLFSFLVGIGTTAIEELMLRSRTRPVRLRRHTVILGLGEHSHFLLQEFAQIYRKNVRALRSAVLGPTAAPPENVAGAIDAFQYRHGDPVRAEDLDRVDVARAKRVVVLGTDPVDPDATVVGAILATRDRNPTVELYADLEHESSLDAARTAGGARTHVIGSGSFVGNYIAQNVANPGIYRLYRQLLTSAGCEIYTYVFDDAERARFLGAGARDVRLDCAALHARAARDHRVWLLGFFVAPPDELDVEWDDLGVLLAPTAGVGPDFALDAQGMLRADAVRGVIGVSLAWKDARAFARSFVAQPRSRPSETPPALDDLVLTPTGDDVRRVLILGDSRRIPRVAADVAAFYGDIDVDVRVRDADRISVLARDIRTAFERTLPDAALTATRSADEAALEAVGARGVSRVRVGVADWSDSTRLAQDLGIDLSAMDVVLFLPRTRGADALDGVVALDCLQLARLEAAGRTAYGPRARVLAMIQDPVKGDLLERRLDAMTGGPSSDRFTVVSSERVRHHFIVQNVFVRGLNTVFRALFDPGGPSIRRLEPRTRSGDRPVGDVDPHELGLEMLTRRRLAFLGLELETPSGEPEIVLDPRALPPGRRIPWSRIRAVYAVGHDDPVRDSE